MARKSNTITDILQAVATIEDISNLKLRYQQTKILLYAI